MSAAQRLRDVPPELRTAGIAAAALAASLLLPWYQKSYFVVVGGRPRAEDANLSALGVFSFVEAAVLLVAGAALFLVWARSERKGFHLPGGDGTAISLAGGWALLLLVWRLFDKPDVDGPGATVGIQWGMFGALVAAGALLAAGARVRAAHRPEPPNPAAGEPEARPAPPRRRRRPADPGAVSEALSDRPAWTGEPPEPPAPHRRPRARPEDDVPTRRLPEDTGDEPTRRLPDEPEDPGEAPTRRLPDDPGDAPTRRLRDGDSPRDRLF